MKKEILILATITIIYSLFGCSSQKIYFENDNLDVINRDIVSINNPKNSLILDRKIGDGMVIIKDFDFDEGIIELELKGENIQQKSFVGIAFNIQNDSTYEAIYFRPFNFKSDNEINRQHSIQYIYKPEFEWRFLRDAYEGVYEAEYPRQPSPDDWFAVLINIDDKNVYIYDKKTNTELLSVKRLTNQISNRIGLWTGFNSKGAFRNLKIKK